MAADVESLLHDVLVFLQRLQPQHLPVDALEIYKALLERLQRLDSRPSYLDMNGARTLHRMRLSDLPPATAAPDVDDADGTVGAAGAAGAAGARTEFSSSADCSDCQDDCMDEWPPRKAPSCVRPDLSPDWGISAEEAAGCALHYGPVYRGGPCRWFRRRGWAALLPGRLLVYTGLRASRPRLVLLLTGGGGGGGPAPCCAACCAVYSARPRPEGLAFELCCPGRKTHQLWVTDPEEAKRWLEELRRVSDGDTAPGGGAEAAVESSCLPLPPPPTRPPSTLVTSLVAASAAQLTDVEPELGGDQRGAAEMSAPASPTAPAAPASYASPASPAIPVTTMKRLPSLPTLAASADNPEHQQEQYESMLSGQEEIYHDIAPPTTDGPSYANIPSLKSDSEMNKLSTEMDNLDIEARPLYDDVVVPPKAPEYCNLTQDTSSFVHDKDGEQGMADHLYDDIGPTESRASVYELIQDPMISQGIRCS